MKIDLAYGMQGLKVEIPDGTINKVLSMRDVPVCENISDLINKALANPIGCDRGLAQIARSCSSACILICDITRPVPNNLILPPLLEVLHSAGLRTEDICILIATGIHRPNLGGELIELVGEDIAGGYRVENHYGTDRDSHHCIGTTGRGTDVWLDSRFCDADLKIATGFIEPHLMAGFSGGRKLVIPGIAHLETVKRMHRPELMDHPNTREGVLKGNPFHEEAVEIARMAGLDFIINVALDEKRRITGIFAGDMEAAHLEGIQHVKGVVRDTVREQVDVVITTGGGYPLDATWYQAIKGLTAAMQIVKPGGTIIIAAECSSGLGSDYFTFLIRDYPDLDRFMDNIYRPDFFVIDQWQLQEYVRASRRAEIVLVSDGLSDEEKKIIHPECFQSVEEALEHKLGVYGKDAEVAVIPKGPYILAEVLQ